MARWRRWEFAVQAPLDDFVALVERGLAARGAEVEGATHFDLAARGFGARAFLTFAFTDAGVALTCKLKGHLFASPAALERLVLESAQEAEARLRAPAKA